MFTIVFINSIHNGSRLGLLLETILAKTNQELIIPQQLLEENNKKEKEAIIKTQLSLSQTSLCESIDSITGDDLFVESNPLTFKPRYSETISWMSLGGISKTLFESIAVKGSPSVSEVNF